MSSLEERRVNRILVIVIIGALGVGGRPHGHAQAGLREFLFGLNGDNTAYDFMSAPIKRQVDWEMTMCHDGKV